MACFIFVHIACTGPTRHDRGGRFRHFAGMFITRTGEQFLHPNGKNQQETAANNATRANAGMLPTVDLSASYSGDLGSTRTTPRSTGVTTTERGAYDGTVDAGIDLNWTIFDGFSVWTNYKQLQLLKEQGELQTRITIEDYVASLTAEYYNYIQEKSV